MDKLLGMENEFASLCYKLSKLNNRKNASNLSVKELQMYSVYEFYKLKEQLLADKPLSQSSD